jgi:hypothetical protein
MRKYFRIFESTSCFHNVFSFHVISLMWPKLLSADGGPWPLTQTAVTVHRGLEIPHQVARQALATRG